MRQVRSRLLASLVLAALFLLPAFAIAQDHWTQVGNMASPRVFATVTTLDDGRVLIVGGTDDGTNRFASVDINDPATATTVAGPSLAYGRYGHSAIKLNDGRVLVVGGLGDASGEVVQIEIFDPVANTWTTGADTPHLATLPVLALLPDGRVLVAATRDDVDFQSNKADIYDPVTNTWSAAAQMNVGQTLAAGATLADGRIMVAGGQGGTDVEIYDAGADSWATKAPLNQPDFGVAGLFRSPDGRLVFAGSFNQIEFYDVAADTWTPASANPSTIAYQIPILLSDGRILLAGGVDSAAPPFVSLTSTTIYDPVTDTWSAGAPMVAGHAVGKAAALSNGKFVVAGGYIGGNDVIEMTGPNQAPIANAGPDVAAATCDACVGGVVLNGGASSDPDGDALTYIWREGLATLATTTQATTTITLGPGAHTLTLTVRDTFGVESTDTVIVTVTNVEDGWRAMVASLQAQIVTLQGQVATLTSSNAILQAQLAACQAGGGGGVNITPLMDGYEQYLRTLFRDPSFELPGTTSISELQNLLTALKKLDKDDEKKIYRLLGGHKMHQGHKGRTKPHWDDDCDYDEDNDHRR